MTQGGTFRYDAFISYRHVEPDRRSAMWLHRSLEAFRTPRALVKQGYPKKFKRVFRDEEELAASADLSGRIDEALQQSRYLIVVCSRRAVESRWINEEIKRFGELGRGDCVLALMIEGEPGEVFPPALRSLHSDRTTAEAEPLAADIRPRAGESLRFRKRMAVLRLAATVLGCRFDDLRQRAQERRNRRLLTAGTLLALAIAAIFPIRDQLARSAALKEAATARAEAAELTRRAEATQGEVDERRRWVDERRGSLTGEYVATAARAEFARAETSLRQGEAEVAELTESVRRALERAARYEAPWGGVSRETHAALADFFFARWTESVARGDAVQAGIWRALVLEHDPAREAAMLGRGALTVTVGPDEPLGATAYLFRYVSYEGVRSEPAVIPRLVPVPTHGVGVVREGSWSALEGGDTFHPGDPCLRVTSVEPRSPAAAARLVPGDLVVRIAGQPCGDGLFVTSVFPGSPTAEAGIEPGRRVDTIDGGPVEGLYELWAAATDASRGETIRVGFGAVAVEGKPRDQPLFALGTFPVPPAVLLAEEEAPGPLRLTCLRRGVPMEVSVAEGESSGLSVEPTAYPLILAEANQVPLGEAIVVDPGSYLVYARAPGFEAQQVPLVVPREGTESIAIELLRAGTTPEGYVYVPGRPYVTGGDASAPRSGPRETRLGEGFFLGRKEVTHGEWAEFLRDPDTMREIAAARDVGMTIYIPRSVTAPTGYVNYKPSEDVPVSGISRMDIDAYLAWRNRRARAEGQPWVYDLPTEWEWEHAARGADARYFPWGDRFDTALCVCYHRKERRLKSFDGGYEPCDESVYGVLDMGGSRTEWTRDGDGAGGPGISIRGGSWGQMEVKSFRAASRFAAEAQSVDPSLGFRLVLRRKDP